MLAATAGVEGWLTDAQARRLWERARRVPPGGRIVELGSYRGRSAIVLAGGAPEGVAVLAVDPHTGNDRGPRQIHGSAELGEEDRRAFRANLRRAGVDERVRHLRVTSREALGAVDGDTQLVYVDGAHRYGPARDDLAGWGARVPPGGTLMVHDAFSSIGVTLAVLRLMVPAHAFRYLGRTGSLAEYERVPLAGAARARNALRQLAELPWFARNLAVKLALVAGLRPLARLLGHRNGHWPH
ncbi:MAG: class I SAM-dependent methyltransferase [Thermoleophilaceae bacterium]